MGAVTTGLMTFEEFEHLPEHDQPGKRELLEGELIQLPRAVLEHLDFSTKIYDLARDALAAAHARGEALELGKVYPEGGYQLGPNTFVQPDVSITHAAQAHGKYLIAAPAIAIEVISDRNTAREMQKKLVLYFGHGALEVWHIFRDPVQIVVNVPGSSRTISEGSVITPLLPGFELPLAELEALIRK